MRKTPYEKFKGFLMGIVANYGEVVGDDTLIDESDGAFG